MKGRYSPPPKSSPPKQSQPKDGNALWRIPAWFPNLPSDVGLKLKAFHFELLKFNAKLNLISKGTERDADETHFADCILFAEILMKIPGAPTRYDIGSGNGFPGLVLAIMDPKQEYVLVDSDVRKGEFLKHCVSRLELKNVRVITSRFEELTTTGMEFAISRGVASISKNLLSFNKIFSRGGQFVHMKGSSWSKEIAELPSQLISIWTPSLLGEYTFPVSQARRAVVLTQKT